MAPDLEQDCKMAAALNNIINITTYSL
jgi:hypothetical protein